MKAFVTICVILVAACSGKVSTDPVPECKAYEAELSSCLHRPTQFASQATLIPKTREEREQIRQTCIDNLARLRTACR